MLFYNGGMLQNVWRPELLKAQASGRLPGAPPHYFMTISTPFSRPGLNVRYG